MMKARYRALALPALALCACVYTGCGPANEDTLKGESKVTPQKSDVPNFSSYGELQQYKLKEAQQNKGSKGKTETKEAPAPEKTKEAEKTK
jgi:hypothetical protein